ncbi:hypothetical protein GCK32_005763 [Trichostrongylus colubriformis]|uniref:Uncharacterized protein n=1 Tax=Trichostrongylus colubriformis TaxID=6319 RepID=A0AAN8FBU7_TRICO
MLVCIRLVLVRTTLLLLFIFTRLSVSDKCYNSTSVNVGKDFGVLESVYRIIGTSQECVRHYEETSPLGADYDYPSCPTGLVSVSVSPIIRIDNSKLLPHIELNISTTVYDRACSVTIRLQCMHAPDAEDIYCHDSTRMLHEGKWLWPCRAIVFDEKDAVTSPFSFGYSCFRMFGLSQYIINVTIFPQQCRSSLLVTSPSDPQLSPEIASYYANKNISSPDWSPLLIVDFGDEDGVWLRVEGPPLWHARVITVSIFERHSDGVLRPLQSVNVIHPSTGFKWQNVAKGDYVVYAHIPRHDCLLICGDVPTSSVSCRLCAHTVINFSLPADRASLSWKGLRRMRDSSTSILYAFACVLFGVASCSMLYLLVLRRRSRHLPVQVREIELQVKPLVLLLTPDDCAEHAAVILALSRVLEKHAEVTVLLDHSEMSNCVVRPYRWLVDSICRASHVLIVISPCTQLVLDGQNLQQRRPFPDLFVPAVNMIIRECTKTTSTPNKYIICRLPYSPAAPAQLSMLGLPEVEVPSDLSRLTALLHTINGEYDYRIPPNCSTLDEFNRAVEEMIKLTQMDRQWMEQRLSTEDPGEKNSGDLVHLPEGETAKLQTDHERERAAEMFGLLPPEENEMMALSQESRKKERRKKRSDSDSHVLNAGKNGLHNNLPSKRPEIEASASALDKVKKNLQEMNNGLVSSRPSSFLKKRSDWNCNEIEVPCNAEPSSCNADMNHSSGKSHIQSESSTNIAKSLVTSSSGNSRLSSCASFSVDCESKRQSEIVTEEGECESAEALHSSDLRKSVENSENLTLPSSSCIAPVRNSKSRLRCRERRVLPEVGTKQRKEILAEDAKRRIRDAANRHSCPHCAYSAPFPSKVRRHISNKHSGSHLCSECGKRFDEFSKLRAHVAQEHPVIHRCQYCQFSHKVLAEVRKHAIANHQKGVACTVAGCNMRVARRRLKNHLQTMHPESVPSACSLDVHSKISLPEESSCFTCTHCDFITGDLEDFNAHVMNAHERGILCPMPDCTLHVLLGDLDNHLRSAHQQVDDSLPEDVELHGTSCSSERLSASKKLASCTTESVSECASTSNHSDDLPSDCDEPNVPEKPLFAKPKGNGVGMQCDLCGKRYRSPYLLKKHIRSVHDKAYSHYRRTRKNVCNWEGCEKAFTTAGLLEDHLNYHKGIKPYRCNSCDIAFAARARFAVHLSKYHRMSIRDYTSMADFLAPSNISRSTSS